MFFSNTHQIVSDLSLLQPYLTEIIFLGTTFYTWKRTWWWLPSPLEKSDQGPGRVVQYKKIDPSQTEVQMNCESGSAHLYCRTWRQPGPSRVN